MNDIGENYRYITIKVGNEDDIDFDSDYDRKHLTE